MTKIMLVEDDKNLSAIYRDRLLAEGYDIVSAHDGEEALAMAVKEKPNLIIADVMMPKISGFDMLDILRSTPETKNTKVIMMTALSQAEDQQRANQLGADKYLVKSQVTLDDVARVVREVLGSVGGAQQAPEPMQESTPTVDADQTNYATSTSPMDTLNTSSAPVTPEVAPQPELPVMPPENSKVEFTQEVTPAPAEITPSELPAEPASQEKQEVENQIQQMADALPVEPQPAVQSSTNTETAPIAPDTNPAPTSPQPLTADKPDIMELYAREMAKESQAQAKPENTPAPNQGSDTQPTDPHSSIAL